MAQPKMVRVRVLRSFQGYTPDGEEKPIHRVGAVIDLEEGTARAELHIKRVEEVDASTPLGAGEPEKETTGETREQIAEREAEAAKSEKSELLARIAKLEAQLADKKK